MQRETLLAITRRAFDEVWSGDNPAAIDEIFAVDYVFHDAGSPAIYHCCVASRRWRS